MDTLKNIGFKKHLMTAISFFLPIVCASGFLLAIGNIMGGTSISAFSEGFSFADTMTTMGGYGLGFLPMIVSAAIAYSIADKPGIAPGLIVGFVAHGINTGFIGGIASGFIAGIVTVLLYSSIKVPKWMEGLMPTLVVPFVASFMSGLAMYYVLGQPINWLVGLLTAYLQGLNSSQLILYGLIIGILSSIDYGGPINKTVFAVVFALFSEGIYPPLTVLIGASMITPFGYGVAYVLQKIVKKNVFDKQDIETLKAAIPMGFCQITEGCFPIVFKSWMKNMIATGVGGAVFGALSMYWGCDSHIPASGMFAVPTMTDNRGLLFTLALLIGSIAHAITFVALMKPVDPEKTILIEEEEEDIDISELKIG
ncbi:PTS fructose transporter subunit IIC [Streptococcus cuniculi]|uniref:PTS fructose transporter subunit IIC n=1 Tax=Streptococcus cuniculi TaxID=1432788 RepID=A0A4Y9J6Z2_9STRE|nr:PTS fructose transporter subunit IIC [Streptococcus cuniculi]MBF0779241.1 PTS fructose transporter subunit IIC [Streptococcus cuniculi]TFU96790.1 PTS fructose transporter subunit IIC [Streptococcus cuniculi]